MMQRLSRGSVAPLLLLALLQASSLLVQGLPSLKATSQEPVFSLIDEDAFVDCKVKDLANYTVVWRYMDPGKDGQEGQVLTAGEIRVASDTRYSILHRPDDEVWVLKIEKAQPADSGIYICELNTDPKTKVARLLSVAEEDTTDKVPSVFSQVDHNYTDCCIRENVPSSCHNFCHFKGLVSDGQPPQVIQGCIHHLSSITKCLADGRNHMPCCRRQNIPQVCRPVCVGNFTLATVLDHFTCMDYTAPVLACIAEGIQTLPPPPKDMYVEAQSPTEIKVSWERPSRGAELIDSFQINVTQLHSFDGTGVSRSMGDSDGGEPSLFGLQLRFTVNGNQTEFLVKDLKAYTMYEIDMMSTNKQGSSIATDSVRTLTLQPETKPSEPSKPAQGHPEPNLPDIKQCCRDNGVQLGRCLDILCDPVKADQATLTDIMICAPWANTTFKCMATGADHSDCCQQRGVSANCMSFCKGDVKRLDFRQFVCIDQMPAYSSCLLDHHGVLPSPPRNFLVVNVHHDWAIIKWQPPAKLAHTIKAYHVHWRETAQDEATSYNETSTLSSPFLLDRLVPGGRYEVFVKSVNQYGTSQSSSRIIFSTPPITPPDEVELSETTLAYNETQCCVRAGLPNQCMPLCSYRVKVTDVLKKAAGCANSLATLVRCAAGGRNHVPCCRRRGVLGGCLNMCAGLVETSAYVVAARCSDDLGKMLQCMEEGTTILPGMPIEFHAMRVTKNSIHLQWQEAPEDRDAQVNFQVRYGKAYSDLPLHPLEHTSSLNSSDTSIVVKNLEAGTRYSFYVVASNMYGISLPSLVLVANTTLDEDDKSTIIRARVGPPHSIQVLHSSVDTITFKWLPPLYVPPDSSISYIVNYRAVNGTETEAIPGVQDRWIQVGTAFNTMYITNLTYNSQYAIAVQAKTDKNETSEISEIGLVWTDPAIPASVNLPVIIPAGPVVENSNVTFMCIGVGTPVPMLSMLINDQVVMKEERRHISLTVPNIKRDMTTVSCYATNGFGKDAQSAQSSLEIRVRFKPSVQGEHGSVAAIQGGPTRLQCEVSGNPQPRVTWYRDLDNHVEVRKTDKVEFVTVPHSEYPSTWVSSFVIKRAAEDDAGNYLCSAANEFGQDAATVNLKIDSTQQYDKNATACCKKQMVTDDCLDVCGFDVDIEKALSMPNCYGQIDKLMACAADGSDHRQCCRRRGVPGDCIRWCAGLRVAKSSLCAVSASREIVSCFSEGKALLPGPPQEVHVKRFLEDNKVVVEWEPPQKNPELVQWYRVFWRPVGSRDLNRNQTDKPYFELDGLDSHKMYEFVVKSGNHYGLSVFTDPLVISMHSARTTSVGNKMLRILLGVSFGAAFLIALAGALVYGYRRYYVPRRTANAGVSFENPSYMKDNATVSVQFQSANHIEVNANETK